MSPSAENNLPVPPTPLRVGVVGLGNMGLALALGWLRAKNAHPDVIAEVIGYNPSAAACQTLADAGGTVAPDARTVATSCDVLVMAVKPWKIGEVAATLSDTLVAPICVVSVAAGVTIEALRLAMPAARVVVRSMPNTAAALGASTTAVLAEGGHPDATAAATLVFDAVGRTILLAEESSFDVFTALAGSGPAFVFQFAEALADGAVAEGMPRAHARRIAASMIAGAAQLLLDHTGSPAELRDAVASPSGTTIEGLLALEAHGFRHATAQAVRAAARRSRAMGKS